MFRAAFLPIIRISWPYIGFGTLYAVVTVVTRSRMEVKKKKRERERERERE
jgi:hypothetical protein